MHYVRAKTIGPAGHTVNDPVRRDRLPLRSDRSPIWRGVQFSPYWARLARDGDVELSAETPPEEEIEGYTPPEPKRRTPKAPEGSIEA